MVHSNILWHIFEYDVSNRFQFSSNKNENFKPRFVKFLEIVSTSSNFWILVHNAYLKNASLTILIAVKNVKVLTMVYTPCFEELYLNMRNQSGCFG